MTIKDIQKAQEMTNSILDLVQAQEQTIEGIKADLKKYVDFLLEESDRLKAELEAEKLKYV